MSVLPACRGDPVDDAVGPLMEETKRDAPRRAEPDERTGALDRRSRRRWVPATAGWLSFLIGLHDVIGALLPEWHRRMVRLDEYVPGSLNNAARCECPNSPKLSSPSSDRL